jgi:hypothetical protein
MPAEPAAAPVPGGSKRKKIIAVVLGAVSGLIGGTLVVAACSTNNPGR